MVFARLRAPASEPREGISTQTQKIRYITSRPLYAHRHTVENANARLKRFRRIGTRYDKLAETFLGFVLLAASLDWINSEV